MHKLMELPRKEYPSWEFPSAMPDEHVLIEVDCARGKEDVCRVVIPCLYHLAKFPRFINKRWGVSVIEPRFKSDGVKAYFRHEFPKTIGAWIFLLIKGGETPKNVPLSYRSGGY